MTSNTLPSIMGKAAISSPRARAPSAISDSSARSGGSSGAADARSQRLVIRKATILASAAWPAFILLDLYMIAFLFPEAPLWRSLSLRVVQEVFLYGVYRMSLRTDVPPARLLFAHNVSFASAGVAMSIMAIDFGGLTSSYLHGNALAVLVRAVVIAAPWRCALRALAPFALTFPAIMGVAALHSATIRAQWQDRRTLLTFLAHYVLMAASVIIGAIASHVVWTAQRQVYQARKLGRYRLEAPIGHGGMNQIWLAWDETLKRDIALKILRATDVDEEVLARFEREAHASSKLTDPHTIRIFDFGSSDDGVHYIAMEYLRGLDLAALVEQHGPLPPARAARFAVQACQSLAEAHAAGIVHRDIKPQNLFVTQAGEEHDFLKLLDFGIARVLATEHATQKTRTGVIQGTPAFMSPEVCRGDRADSRSDLYGLGATLYFLLAGSPPFEGTSTGNVLAAHLLHTPEPPSSRRGAALPDALEDIVMRCLAKDPLDRFQTAHELCEALAPFADSPEWTAEDARRFWQVDRPAKLSHTETQTSPG